MVTIMTKRSQPCPSSTGSSINSEAVVDDHHMCGVRIHLVIVTLTVCLVRGNKPYKKPQAPSRLEREARRNTEKRDHMRPHLSICITSAAHFATDFRLHIKTAEKSCLIEK